jgi:hypothetical protein
MRSSLYFNWGEGDFLINPRLTINEYTEEKEGDKKILRPTWLAQKQSQPEMGCPSSA